jgi:hypothetical protein
LRALGGSEKTTFDKVKDKASDLGDKAADKAVELKNAGCSPLDRCAIVTPLVDGVERSKIGHRDSWIASS